MLGSPELDPALQMCLTRAEQRARITSLNLLVMPHLMQPRMLVTIFAMRVHRWLLVNLMSTRTLGSLSVELVYSQTALRLYWLMGLFCTWFRILHFPLLVFLPGHFFSLLRSLSVGGRPSSASAAPPRFFFFLCSY